jgi:hypothetical protein
MDELKGKFLDTSEILATARTGQAKDLRRVLKAKSRQSLYWNSKVLFNYNKLTQGFHLPLCQHIQETQQDLRRIYLVPRTWFKSTIIGKTYPMWRLQGGGLEQFVQEWLIHIEFCHPSDECERFNCVANDVPSSNKTGVEAETDRISSFYEGHQEIDPRNHRIVILSESQDIANKDIIDPKWHIEGNQQFRWLFPELLPANTNKTVWNNSEILLPRSRSFDESTLTAVGLDSANTGFHYTIIVWDDLAGEKAAGSPPLMEAAKNRIRNSAGLRHDPGKTEELGAMTRWGHGTTDVPGMLMEELPYKMIVDENTGQEIPSGYKFYIREAERIDDNGKRVSNFPERFSVGQLDEIHRLLKDYMYNCNYMNRPSSPEGSDFNPQLWKEFDIGLNPQELMQGKEVNNWITPLGLDGQPEGQALTLGSLFRLGFYDPSSGGKTAKCEGAITCLGQDYSNRIFVFEMWGKNCGYQEALEQFYQFNDQYYLHQRFYEDVGAQKELETIVSMRRLHLKCPFCGKEHRQFNLLPFKPGTSDKHARIRLFMQPAYDEGRIYFRKGIHAGMAEGRRQITGIPHYPIVDRADSCASGIKNLRTPTSEEEREAQVAFQAKRATPPLPRTWTGNNYGGYV